MHICIIREMGAVCHDAYMQHQAKMSWIKVLQPDTKPRNKWKC